MNETTTCIECGHGLMNGADRCGGGRNCTCVEARKNRPDIWPVEDPLSPARGVMYGIALGLGLWAVAILIATWWLGR